MILLMTDFGVAGPYVGQVRMVLARVAPSVPVIDLFADLPAFRPDLAGHLIAAYGMSAQAGDVVLAVVDPGVGGARRPLMVQADGRWLVGPDNGLFELVLRRAAEHACWTIDWRPSSLSASFHGRDLFAPVAARLARGRSPPGRPAAPTRHPDWPDDLAAIVYVDHYGNLMTGMRAAVLAVGARLELAGQAIERGRTFSDVPAGAALWYENANGLVEIAINGGSAAECFGAAPGTPVEVLSRG